MLGKLFSSGQKEPLPWTNLNELSQLEEIDRLSKDKPVLLFKHSTRCSISAMALGRFERSFDDEASFDPYFLDLIAYRDISNEIASRYGVRHESPQAILIRDGKAVFTPHIWVLVMKNLIRKRESNRDLRIIFVME